MADYGLLSAVVNSLEASPRARQSSGTSVDSLAGDYAATQAVLTLVQRPKPDLRT